MTGENAQDDHKITQSGPGLRITGVGKALPARIVSNSEIASRLEVDPQWIETRTGITERRFAGLADSAASLGQSAARQALETSGTAARDIDHVIVATCTPDYIFPPTASLIQQSLGIPAAGAFDLGAACSGFVYALATASGMVSAGISRRLLIVGVDLLSRHLNLDDPKTAPLFGDGAGAVIVEADTAAPPVRFELGSDGSGADDVIIPQSGTRLDDPDAGAESHPGCIRMAGREVYRRAVRTMTAQAASLGSDGFDLFIAHQANRRIIQECADQLGIDMEKVFMNIERYGNTSAASVPIAICEAWEQGRLSPGDRLLLVAFGAGYTWGAAKMPWTMQRPAGSDSGRLPAEMFAAP